MLKNNNVNFFHRKVETLFLHEKQEFLLWLRTPETSLLFHSFSFFYSIRDVVNIVMRLCQKRWHFYVVANTTLYKLLNIRMTLNKIYTVRVFPCSDRIAV